MTARYSEETPVDERWEDIFQDEIILSFANIESFKRFARSKNGLCLNEDIITDISEDLSHSVAEQKMRMLSKWKEKQGAKATVSLIRHLVHSFLRPDETQGYVRLSDKFGLYYKDKICKDSDVYKGEYLKSDGCREVVIKLVDNNEKNKTVLKSLLELGHHINVVEIIGSDLYMGSLLTNKSYIVMESCRHENLMNYLKEREKLGMPLDDLQKKAVVRQFLEGLHFIHAKNRIHGDIKPQNLFISKNGKFIKICVCGPRKTLKNGRCNLDKSMLSVSADGFRAPEIYLDPNDSSSQEADVFSAGLVLYWIVSDGEHPFGDDVDDWISNIKEYKNKNLTHIFVVDAQQMRRIIERMLLRNPTGRPTISRILNLDIFQQAKTTLHLRTIEGLSSQGTCVPDGPVAGATPQLSPTPSIRREQFVNEQPWNGKFKPERSEEDLPGYGGCGMFTITYTFKRGQLKGYCYPAQQFTAYLPDGSPSMFSGSRAALVKLLERAFHDRQTFRLEITGNKEGKLVWNDIPHKTSKRGGSGNNGYPDDHYPDYLYEVLRSKGYEKPWFDRMPSFRRSKIQ